MHAIYLHKPPTLDPTYGWAIPHHSRKPGLEPKADWIWANKTADNQTVLFVTSLQLSKVPGDAICRITADDYFQLFINGKPVASSPKTDGQGNPWQNVHIVPVAAYLKPGHNIIAVQAVNSGGAAGMLMAITSGLKTLVGTSKGWRAHDGPLETDTWKSSLARSANWQHSTDEAAVGGGPWGGSSLQGWPGSRATYLHTFYVAPRAITPRKTSAEAFSNLDPKTGSFDVTVPDGTKPEIVVDFGQEMAGRIRVQAPSGTAVSVGTGESIGEALNSPWHGYASLEGAGKTPAATPWSAFRFAHLIFTKTPGSAPVRVRVMLQDKYYPVTYTGAFKCSDPMLNKIWYTGAYTAHLCMQEDIWDAPKRDRMRWMGDLQVSGRVIDDAFADKFLMEQTMQRLRDDAQGSSDQSALPHSHVNGIPGYSAAWIVGLADFEKRVGDTSYIAKQSKLLGSMVSFMLKDLNSDNLYADLTHEWGYVDWSPGFNDDTPLARTATQMYYIRAFKDAAYLFGVLHNSAEQARCTKLAHTLQEAAQTHLLLKDNTFSDRRQDNAMALFADATTPAETSAIYQKVFAPGSPAWNQIATPYYNNYVLFAMSDAGHTGAALKFARDYWGGMIKEGATTFWEAYDLSWPKVNPHKHLGADNGVGYFVSLCHGWSSGVTAWLTERVAGIRPTGTGYSTVTIAPDLGYLRYADAQVPTPHGILRVDVTKSAASGNLSATIVLPAGVTATVVLNGTKHQITHRGTYHLK